MINAHSASSLPAPDRTSGLARLAAFTPAMGRDYAASRNHDFGPENRENVSALSAHVRHRLVLEEELVRAALTAHGAGAAEKFIQEVCWRTYWKGWLEMRPSVWSEYQGLRDDAFTRLDRCGDLRKRYEGAVEGRTGITCFDAWAEELIATGYLHNHARMWFASIWIYTLKLPWELGADHFLRHLIDGDAASNTLSWRWVGGLHTPGKTYLARASNINKFSNCRFAMHGWQLADDAPPLEADIVHPEPQMLAPADRPDPALPTLLLIHEEDLNPESWGVESLDLKAITSLEALAARSPLPIGERAAAFTMSALEDGVRRSTAHFSIAFAGDAGGQGLAALARAQGARQIVTMRAMTGPLKDRLGAERAALDEAGISLVELRRDWDRAFHPHAQRGFFKLKETIPRVLTELGIR